MNPFEQKIESHVIKTIDFPLQNNAFNWKYLLSSTSSGEESNKPAKIQINVV